jgi:hypothetical protein
MWLLIKLAILVITGAALAGWYWWQRRSGKTPQEVLTQHGAEGMSTPNMQFASGAVRGTDANGTRYDLITPVGLRRIAETYAEGAVKYTPQNWEKGIPASDLVNHAMRHIELWRAGDTSEDHLAHAAWNLMAIMHFEESPLAATLIDVPTRPQYTQEAQS